MEPDRDSLEQVAELVTGGEKDFEDLTDEELTDLIEDQLRQEESAGTPAIPGSDAVSDDPAVDTEAASDGYDGNGAMTVPFDQLYPELVEEEQVAYDEETLLLKLHRRQKRSHYGDGGFPSYSQFMLSVASDRNPLSPGERFTVSVCNDWGMSFASFDLSIHYDASMFRLEGQSPVVGEETLSTLTLDAGSGLAAADFELRYDPTLLECLAAEPAADARFPLINPNFSAGTIRFSFVTDGFTDPTGHHHEWFVMAAPTCTEDGLEEGTCTGCGELLVRAIPALGHDWDGTSCRRCGQIRENPFADVPEDSFYYAPVIWSVANGITNGLDAAHFGPFAYCNRAQVVTFLYRSFAE